MKYLTLALGLLTVSTMGFVSCGDDDEIHKNQQKTEQNEDPEEESIKTALSPDGKTFNTGYVKVNENVTIRPYICEDGKWDVIEKWTFDEFSFDSKYVRVAKKLDGEGKLVGFVITGVESTELVSFTVSYIVNGKYCSSEFQIQVLGESDDEKEAKRRSELRSYILSQSMTALPVNFDASTPEFIQTDKGLLRLTLEKWTASQESDGAPHFRPLPSIGLGDIYPGKIIYVDSDMESGNVPSKANFNVDGQLGTCTVYVTFLAEGNKKMYRENVPMEYTKIQEAVGQILSEKGNAVPPTDVLDHSTVTNSQKKAAYDLKCSANFCGASMGVTADSKSSTTKIYSLKMFEQSYYTVSVEPTKGDFVNYLGEGVTLDAYKSASSMGKKIGIIKAVTYGRWGFYKKEYEGSSFSLKLGEEASYKSYFSISANQSIENIANSTKEEGRVYGGGDSKQVLSDTEYQSLRNKKENLQFSFTNQGAILFYEVQYLSETPVKLNSTGTFYNIKGYCPCPKSIYVHIRQNASSATFHSKLFFRTFKYVNEKKQYVDNGVYFEQTLKKDNYDYEWNLDLPKDGGNQIYFEPVANYSLTYDHYRGSTKYNDVEAVNASSKVYVGDGRLNLCIEGSGNTNYNNLPYMWTATEKEKEPYDGYDFDRYTTPRSLNEDWLDYAGGELPNRVSAVNGSTKYGW